MGRMTVRVMPNAENYIIKMMIDKKKKEKKQENDDSNVIPLACRLLPSKYDRAQPIFAKIL